MQLKRWLAAHHLTLMTLPDTPHSIALGAAIGMFFGCTPLLGMKTLLSILVAWICRGNKIAAVISVTLHDLILPFSPAIYLWEYKMGMWALHGQHPGASRFRGHVPLVNIWNGQRSLPSVSPFSLGRSLSRCLLRS